SSTNRPRRPASVNGASVLNHWPATNSGARTRVPVLIASTSGEAIAARRKSRRVLGSEPDALAGHSCVQLLPHGRRGVAQRTIEVPVVPALPELAAELVHDCSSVILQLTTYRHQQNESQPNAL